MVNKTKDSNPEKVTPLNEKMKKSALSHEFFIDNNELNKKNYRHKSNRISTTKYNIFIFLPKALLFQFFRLANVYFLIIAIIQCIPYISPLSASTAIAPLAVVLCVSLIREAYEDIARYKYDKMQNNQLVTVYRDKKWVEEKSGNLLIGEIILVKKNNTFPADLILIDSNEKEGIAYIETGTLDGEKTLKQRIAPKWTSGKFKKDGTECEDLSYGNCFKCEGKIFSSPPNYELSNITATMDVEFSNNTVNPDNSDKKLVSINIDQLLYKGAILKNTEWIIGIVVFTGHKTKLLLNSKPGKIKYSRLENLMSKMLIAILILQSCFCVICAGLYKVYYESNIVINPFMYKNEKIVVDSVVTYFSYILLLNTMIPISLIITLEIVKLVQGYLMSVDVEGYSHVRKVFIKPGSVSLNEELGQINFIFSDKTGTLTCNKMMFKYCIIGDVCYKYYKDKLMNYQENNIPEQEMDIIPIYTKSFAVENRANFNKTNYQNFVIKSKTDPNLKLDLRNEDSVIEEFWKALALGNECSVNNKENDQREYLGTSPDDIELVNAAALQGYELLKPPTTSVKVLKIGDRVNTYELLETFKFSSNRKRLSVIIRDGNLIKLYMKGADSMFTGAGDDPNRLSPESKKEFLSVSRNYVDYFSSQGYRTLFVGMKIIEEKEYNEWKVKMNDLMVSNDVDRESKIKDLESEMEKDLYLIGSTIVEDKLQDQVPETIRDLRMAGIKIWMLTGDKMDTAKNIGLNCNLISRDMKVFVVSGEGDDKVDKLIKSFRFFKENNSNLPKLPPYGILLNTVALTQILSNSEDIRLFLEIAHGAASVICCRVNGGQKAEVVRIMKDFDRTAVTLSIGDGGNDVSMIQQANVGIYYEILTNIYLGIGLFGEEGMQAVQASDYAMGEFKFLRRLLLFHGRINYTRIAEMVLYFFYKNFVFTINHFFFAFYSNCSGQTIIDDWFITIYNLILTAFPLGVRAVSDFDVKPDDGEIINQSLPFLYKEVKENPIFTKTSFILSLFRGIVHAIINFMFLVYNIGYTGIDSKGNYGDIWYFSVLLYTNIIFIVSLRVLILQKYHTWVSWAVMLVLSWVVYFAFIIYIHNNTLMSSAGTMAVAFGSGRFYLNFFLIVCTCAMFDYFTYSASTIFSGSLSGILHNLVIKRNTLNNKLDLPDRVNKLLDVYNIYKGEESNKKEEKNIIKKDNRKANMADIELIDRVLLDKNIMNEYESHNFLK